MKNYYKKFVILFLIILATTLCGCQPKQYSFTIHNLDQSTQLPTLCIGNNGECQNKSKHISSFYISDVAESGETLTILWEIRSDSRNSDLEEFIYGKTPEGYYEGIQAYPLETGVVYAICGSNFFMIVDGLKATKILYAETARELYALENSSTSIYYHPDFEHQDSIKPLQANDTHESLSYNNCYINGLHSIMYSKLTWRIIDANKFLEQMGTEKRGVDRINMYASNALQAANTYPCEDLSANRDALKAKLISILDGIRLEERFGVEIIEVELTVPPSSWD